MKLERIAELNLDVPEEIAALNVSGLAANSSDVNSGFLFFGLPGVNVDGAIYAPQAQANGAVAAVVSMQSEVGDVSIPVWRCEDPRRILAYVSAQFYENQPEIIGAVTGTAGKTSVATFLRQIWEHDKRVAASLGTTGVVAPGRDDYGNLTTPDPISLHKLLNELAKSGITHAAMEASSHGLDQRRLDGVRLSVAGFTNLGRDHLDYHKTVDEYLEAKMLLFKERLPKDSPAVIFADDPFSQATIDAAHEGGCKVLTVGRAGDFISLKKVEHLQFGQTVELSHGGEHYRIEFPLAGDFQIANGLVAAGMAIASGTSAKVAFEALEKLQGASGRLELVGKSAKGAPVYVDYAHKPEALENVLSSLRPFTSGCIILAFGCGGDRDPGKRAIMGEIASRLADVVIVTDDNPRTENPADIRKAILDACVGAIEIGDRGKAIEHGCEILEEGDCLVVAGKGHEPGQIIGDQVLPFSDHDVIRKVLNGVPV
jgi:UDP-N-acetylmuramoyl-L-alanyl-D-glutamate--2,6-diaminopimelate ligase